MPIREFINDEKNSHLQFSFGSCACGTGLTAFDTIGLRSPKDTVLLCCTLDTQRKTESLVYR